ncbi:MAG: thioesterase, FlK family [Polaromonas sp.]
MKLKLGLKGVLSHDVTDADLATNWRNDVPVLATPILLWLAELACMRAIENCLDAKLMSLGLGHDSRHLAPTPKGWTVTVEAELVAISEKTLTFDVRATDQQGEIFSGHHTRAIVNRERFIARVVQKSRSAPKTPAGQPPLARAVIDPRKLAMGALLAGGIFLGVAPVVVKAVDLPPEVSAFYRVLLSAPAFAVAAFIGGGGASRALSAAKPTAVLFVLAAICFAADLAIMHMAIRMTNVAVATLFTNSAPFFVGLLGLVGLSDRPTRRFWQALPVALVGAILLIGADSMGGGAISGDLLALLAAMFYAGYLVIVRELRARGATSSSVMVWVTAMSTVLLLPLFVMAGAPVPKSWETWSLILVLVFVGQFLGQGLVTIALRQLPASLSSIVLLIQPVVAAVLSWAVLSERLDFLQIFGIAVVLAAIAYATMGKPSQAAPSAGGPAAERVS